MKRKVIGVVLSVAMVASMLAGCGSSDSSSTTSTDAATEEKTDDTADAAAEESGDKKFKIGVAMKTQDGPYFVALANGLVEQCVEQGLVDKAEDVVVLNANMDVTKQTENFETFVTQDYDMIFCDCIDPDNVIADEKNAMDAGIPVINVDSGVNESHCVTTVYSDNKQNGRACGLSYAEFMGDKEIYSIMLSGEKGNVAGNERRQGLICGILEQRLGISEEEAWKMTEEADATLLSTGSYTNEEAKFTIAGQGWGTGLLMIS